MEEMVLCAYTKEQCPFVTHISLPCEKCPRYLRYLNTEKRKMSTDKKKIIVKTYSTSWITTIIFGIIAGFIGAILGNASNQAFMGFLVGFIMVFVAELLILASLIPFVGVYLYWVWSCWFYNWIINIAFAGNQALINNFLTFSLLPLILFAFFGIIICVIFSILAVVFIGAIIGAISR